MGRRFGDLIPANHGVGKIPHGLHQIFQQVVVMRLHKVRLVHHEPSTGSLVKLLLPPRLAFPLVPIIALMLVSVRFRHRQESLGRVRSPESRR